MEWDWQQFVTPSSTPTNTNASFDNLYQGVNSSSSGNHFHDAFSPNVHVHQRHDSVDSTHVPGYAPQPHPQQYQPYAPPYEQSRPHSQMQTPPPTRDSSFKRTSYAAMTDQGVMRQPDFSPTAFNFSAPHVEWSQPPAVAPPPTVTAWPVPAEDPFSQPQWQQQPVNAPACPHPQPHGHPYPQPPPPPPHPQQPTGHVPPPLIRSNSLTSLSYPTPSTAKKVALASSVDPSLLYTPPGRPVQSNPDSRPVVNEPPRVATTYPQASGSPVRVGLHRSNTTGGLQPTLSSVSSGPASPAFLARSNSVANLPRRSSPLKRNTRASLSSISETGKPQFRTSVVLTIDANGTARTETRLIEEPPNSAKEKYSSLWNASDSDSDSAASKQWPSRNSSLAYGRDSQERQTKVPKLDPPSQVLEPSLLPRSNSTASLRTPSKAAYAAAAHLRRQGSAKKQQRPSMHSRRNTLSSLNSSFENLATMDLNSDEKHVKSDAGTALRQVVANRASQPDQLVHPHPIRPNTSQSQHEDRPQSQPQSQPQAQAQPVIKSHIQPQLQSHPRPQPQLPPQHRPSSPPLQQAPSHTKSQSFTYAPQLMGAPGFDPRGYFPIDSTPMSSVPVPATLPTDLSPVTRCICHIPIDDGRMVQCGLCTMWSHTGCLGLDPLQYHSSYICSFCTNPVHPVRSTSMQNFNPWPVPGL